MITFYSVPTANGQKVAIMLELLQLSFETINVDLYSGQHLSEEYLKISPSGRAPTIVDNDSENGAPLTVYGTLAIALYLAEKTGALLPATSNERAQVFEISALLVSDLSPALSGQFIFSELMPQSTNQVVDYFEETVNRMLAVVESRLRESKFVAGSQMSIADVLLYPVAVTSLQRMPGTLEKYSALRRWQLDLAKNDAFQRGIEIPLAAASAGA